MSAPIPTTLAVAVAAVLATAAPAPRPPRGEPMIRYHVTMPEHAAHRVRVEMTVEGLDADVVDVSMPVWTPGSYLVREFARHVYELDARGVDGEPLPYTKVDKNTWRVSTAGREAVVVDYRLYANELSVRTNHVDASHAFLSPAGSFLYVADRQAEPHQVTVSPPDGWRVFTALAPDGGGWTAADYDELVDSPIEIGPHEALEFELRGVPHRVVLAGESDLDAEDFLADVEAICAEVAQVFEVTPFDSYTFLMLFTDGPGGGLEHLDSSVCMFSRWRLGKKKDYRRFLSLVAHEYFHAWNVKRFRPAALGPFEYDHENYTRDLWVAEGITSYFDDLSVARAGFVDDIGDYLDARAADFRTLARTPGRRRMSLAEASFDAWIKHYRPDENSGNVAVSYYSKGALVSLMLDLRLRGLTDGERGLADVLNLGWQRYTERGVGFPDGAIPALAAEVADHDLSAFFDAYVYGTEELDPSPDLAVVGLQLERTPKKAADRPLDVDDEDFPLEPTLGIRTSGADGGCRITAVLEDGPGFAAGLNVDDVLLALGGVRVTQDTLQSRLDRNGAAPVDVAFFRGQQLRTVTLTPRLERLEQWKITPLDDATDVQRARFEAWSGHPFPGEAADDAESEESPGEDDEER